MSELTQCPVCGAGVSQRSMDIQREVWREVYPGEVMNQVHFECGAIYAPGGNGWTVYGDGETCWDCPKVYEKLNDAYATISVLRAQLAKSEEHVQFDLMKVCNAEMEVEHLRAQLAEQAEDASVGKVLIALHQSEWLMWHNKAEIYPYIIVDGNGFRRGEGKFIADALRAAGLLPVKAAE